MAENSCVVCFKNCHIYSVGECDHPVCFECSTRMRVICRQNECPMCRHEMEMVVFTEKIRPFRRLKRKYALFDSKHHIAFDSKDIKDEYDELLHFICKECIRKPIFDSFQLLNEHMEKEHEKFCCNLCVDSLKIFPAERRYYTKRELNRHRSKGDVDDKSHRGHPLCEFCDVRYVDRDELYRHLRKEHLFCHICDREGIQQFYGMYDMLREHYRAEHYLCEEGECFKEQLTSVFPTEVDLKVHRALVHSKNVRHKNRTIEIDFPLPARGFRERRGAHESHTDSDNQNAQSSQQTAVPIPFEQAFPSLTNSSVSLPKPRFTHSSNNRLAFDDRNFPALGSEQNAPVSTASTSAPRSSAAAAVGNSKKSKTKNQPPSNQLSLTWVKKAKEKKPVEKKSANSAPENVQPPDLNRENFPGLQADDSPDNSQSSNKSKKTKKYSACTSKQTKINYSEMIAKSTTNASKNKEKEGIDKKTDPQSSNSKEKSSSFLLNANRKKVKMKPDVLVRLNNLGKNQSSLPKQTSTNSDLGTGNSESATSSFSSDHKSQKERKIPESNCDNIKTKLVQSQRNQANEKIIVNKMNGEKTDSQKNKTSNDKNNNKNSKQNFENNNKDEKLKAKMETQVKGSSSRNSENAQKVSKPPPGFEQPVVKAPPGLEPLNNARMISMSDSAAFYDDTYAPVFSYQHPSEYVSRNFRLFEIIGNSLKNQHESALNDFKSTSLLFREGYILAADYYMYCMENIKSDKFLDVFVDLVALLPDIMKQQELWAVHSTLMPSAVQNSLVNYCNVCLQILKLDDTTSHYSKHGIASDSTDGFV